MSFVIQKYALQRGQGMTIFTPKGAQVLGAAFDHGELTLFVLVDGSQQSMTTARKVTVAKTWETLYQHPGRPVASLPDLLPGEALHVFDGGEL